MVPKRFRLLRIALLLYSRLNLQAVQTALMQNVFRPLLFQEAVVSVRPVSHSISQSGQ